MVGRLKYPRPIGKSIQRGSHPVDIKKDLAELKKSLLAEFAELLIGLRGDINHSKGFEGNKGIQDSCFIPETILGALEANIEIEQTKSDSDDINEAAEALRKLKKQKDGTNE